MKAISLKTEYLINPIGLDILKPRFFWNCEDGDKQTAYQIIAERNDAIVWDSGKVLSDKMVHITYEGEQLNSCDKIVWKVRLWDEYNTNGSYSYANFEMGLLKQSDWAAQWISGDYPLKKNKRYPVDCFKKDFTLKESVKRARLYITACGLYEANLNGKKIGDFVLAPGCTDYRYRLQYQAYDVTEMLGKQNVLEFKLADGWYRGSIGCFGLTNVFGRQTKLLFQLEIDYIDGNNEKIISDESVLWSNDGPIRFADLKDGEVYDAGKICTYSGTARAVKEEIFPAAANNVAICEKEKFQAKLIITPSGKKVLDFGQNIAGFISFTVKGNKGEKINLHMGEILDGNGEFTQANIQVKKPTKEFGKITEIMLITGNTSKIKGNMVPTPCQKVEFICSGREDNYKTAFAFFGFRYALIETTVDFDPAQFYAIAIYSDLEQTGSFSCSNKKINRFVESTLWSMKGNFIDIPMDCPTRERLGWTGDAQIFFNTAAYFMNVAPFFRKWMTDIKDSQFKDGKSSAVVPYTGADMLYKSTGGSVGWCDAVVLIPYRYWKRYGDEEILKSNYTVMRKYARYMIKNTGMKNIKSAKENPFNQYTYEKGMHLGEWLEPEEFRDTSIGLSTLHTEECTAYLHYTMATMAEVAAQLGEKEDEALYTKYAEGAIHAYDWLFLQEGTIDTDRQAKMVRPLALGLLNDKKKKNVQNRLVKAIENREYCIGTGFLSTPFVLPVLTEANRVDVAYKMMENEKAPSWLNEVNAGATTVWENWNGEASNNHYSPGAVCEWLFDTVAGIRIIGENHFKINPTPGGSLTTADAHYDSVYGTVQSRWNIENGIFTLHVTVPSNTSADIIMPNGECNAVSGGDHTFSISV